MRRRIGPIGPHSVVSRQARFTAEGSQQAMCRVRVIQGLDQWLDDGNGAIVGARIAPGFQEMRFGNMPEGLLRSFVEVRRQVDRRVHILQFVHEIKIVRRIVNRIAAEHEQHIDFAAAHVGAEVVQ